MIKYIKNYRGSGRFFAFALNDGESGFTLVELVLAIALFVIIAAGVAVPIVGSYLTGIENQKSVAATAVLTEGWEAVRAIRGNDFASLSTGTHGLRNNNGYWEFFGGMDVQNGFTRTVTLSAVSRNISGDIVTSGGQNDPDSREVQISVSWQPSEGQNRLIQSESLITNYVNPGPWPPA